MGGEGSNGFARERGSGAEAAVLPLKEDEPVAEDAELIERSAKVRGNGSEIFTDDEKMIAGTFESKDAEKVLEMISYVSSTAGI